ncbi:MAG: hypothetical protein ACK5M7_04795 [Draconibacterium sp.]
MNCLKKNGLLFVLCLILGLGSLSTISAQQIISGELELCEGQVLPVKLEDVVGLGLSAGGGSWHEVSEVDSSLIVEENVSNIFLGIDRLPGTYKFLFVPSNNPCLNDDDRALATIQILPTPKPISHFVALCSDQTVDLDLSTLIAKELTDMYPDISYIDGDGNILSSSVIPIDSEGELLFSYKLNSIGACVDSAAIILSVISNGIAGSIDFDSSLAFCQSAVPDFLNLNAELGLTGKDGNWEAVAGSPSIVEGIVDLIGATVGDYEYTYKWNDCNDLEQNRSFTISITDDLSPVFVDVEHGVCKTVSTGGFIDLMDIIGVGLPANAGVWTEVSSASPVDVADGIFEIADSRTGKYEYKFTVGNAVELCGIQGNSVVVTLDIYDNSEVLDGEVQLCYANLVSGTMLDLNEFMPGISVGGTWHDTNGAAMSGSTIDEGALGLGVFSYEYSFPSGPCGDGSANLLVVVTDMLTNLKNKTKSYCLTDDGSDSIDLDQILGVGNVPGSWENTSNVSNYDDSSHVFDGKTEGVGTYNFTFTAAEGACGINENDQVIITIIITDDLTQ